MSQDQANFKIGPSVVARNPNLNLVEQGDLAFFYHPNGTRIQGFPRYSRLVKPL